MYNYYITVLLFSLGYYTHSAQRANIELCNQLFIQASFLVTFPQNLRCKSE